MKVILSVNSGSSSVKISVYTVEQKGDQPRQIAEAQISGLTSPPPKLSYSRVGKDGSSRELQSVRKDEKVEKSDGGGAKIDGQEAAFNRILEELLGDDNLPQLGERRDVAVVAHRIVHGGDASSSQHITPDTLHHLEALSDLAPLHNGPSLAIVRACMDESLPEAVNVACFDTQFHASIPKHIRTYPIDQAVARANGLRKYGFHGISYAFITRACAAHLGRASPRETNLIALHLGSGASACAVRLGRSHDTSMGLTPLAGLPGATRSGSVDPSLVFHYASDMGKLSPNSTSDLHISRAEEILNKEAGWKALAGTTDFGAIAAAKEKKITDGEEDDDDDDSDDARRRLAFDLFVDRVCGFVGSYYVLLSGQVDALVFAGGIGEKSALLRRAVVKQCACLGFAIDEARNEAKGLLEGGVDVADISSNVDQKHRVLVCKTDEQLEMARWCAEDEELWRAG